MFNPLIGRPRHDDGADEAPRPQRARDRLGTLFTIASALAIGFAFMAAPPSAQALSSIDGPWTVSHGGTGHLSLNGDGTYTSTCEAYANYPDAWCPASSGTFQYSTMGSANVTFNGADGSSTSYRVGGDAHSPDWIESTFTSRTNSPLVMTKGSEFVCTDWTLPIRLGTENPLVERDAATGKLYLTGSHQLVTTGDVAETAPNYFQNGYCDNFAPPIHVHLSDISTPSYDGWTPQVSVTVTDEAGAPVYGVSVHVVFSNGSDFFLDCSWSASCTAESFSAPDSVPSVTFTVLGATRNGDIPVAEGDVLEITLHNPNTPTPTPTPTPATHHIGDLDNATASLSPSPKAAAPLKWQPKVTAKVVDSQGKAVAGATVKGTFSHHKGTLTCVTVANGTCTLGNSSLSRYTRTTVFTVTNVTLTSSTYTPKANTDPDGDSNGTTITVKRQ